MAKEKNTKGNLLAGLAKFQDFAGKRGYELVEETYGIHRVVNKGRVSNREAVQAYRVNDDGSVTFGWVINLAGRERVFKPEGGTYKVYA